MEVAREYLSSCYGDRLGFPFTWIYNALAKACAMAIIAMVFVENLSFETMPVGIILVWDVKTCAIPGIVLITFIIRLGMIARAHRRGLRLIPDLEAIRHFLNCCH